MEMKDVMHLFYFYNTMW